MFQILTTPRMGEDTDKWKKLHVAATVVMLTFYLLAVLVPSRFEDLYQSYGRIAIVIMVTLYFYHQRLGGVLEIKLMSLYLMWIFVSRILQRDFYLFQNIRFLHEEALCLCIFAAGTLADTETRRKYVDAVSLIFGTFVFLISAAGVFITLTNTYIHIPPENVWITVRRFYPDSPDAFNALNLLSLHRNFTAIWLLIGFCFMMYQFFACRRKLWRIPIVIAMLTEALALVLCRSRTNQLVLFAALGMMAMLIGMDRIKNVKRQILIPALCVVFAVITFGGYKLGDASLILISAVSQRTVPAFEELYSSSEHKLPEDLFGIAGAADEDTAESADASEADTKEAKGVDMVEKRDFGRDAKTMTGRTEIWKTLIPSIKYKPSIAFVGSPFAKMMELPNRFLSWEFGHMHNFLLMVLLATGFPGFFIVIAICASMAVRMIKLFFKDDIEIKTKILTIPVTCCFVYFMLEQSLFTNAAIPSIYTFCLMGVVLGDYYDVFPKKK